ncbi:MAG: hypothetical protein ABIK28_08855 [Planctomycetota bacterium]
MEKKKRLHLISEILQEQTITDQHELLTRLAGKGIEASQASLSRDLKQLGVHRVRGADGRFAYCLPETLPAASTQEAFRRRFATSATGIRRSQFIVLVLTPPGEAQLVGRLLDAHKPAGLLGTLAGDDTVICITKDNKSAVKLEKEFKEILK